MNRVDARPTMLGRVNPWLRLVSAPDDRALVSHVWSLPALQHEALFRRRCFDLFLQGHDVVPQLLERLATRGIERVQLVSFMGWNDHPFAKQPMPNGFRVTLEREEERDHVKSMWLRVDRPR